MSRETVYKTRITGKALLFAAIPLAAASVLVHFALDANSKFAPSDPTRYLFVGVPVLLAAVIFLTLLLVCHHFLGRTMILRNNELIYQDSKVSMQLKIAEMAFSPPSETATLKTIMFSDGKTFIQIPEIFLGGKAFDELNRTIKKLRRDQRHLSSQKTYSL